jgi:hypothetical protein
LHIFLVCTQQVSGLFLCSGLKYLTQIVETNELCLINTTYVFNYTYTLLPLATKGVLFYILVTCVPTSDVSEVVE